MNNTLNFITTLSPQEQKKINMWYTITILTFFILSITIILLQGKQYLTLKKLQKRHDLLQKKAHRFDASQKKYNKLKRKHDYYTQCATHVQEVETQHKKLIACLESLAQQTPKTVTLSSVTLANQQFYCTATCAQLNDVTSFLQILEKNTTLKNITLTSLHTDTTQQNNKVTLSLSATLT